MRINARTGTVLVWLIAIALGVFVWLCTVLQIGEWVS
jgi:hypothetical protein